MGANQKIYVNNGGTFTQAQQIYVNQTGTWKTVKKVYVNQSGSWTQVYPTPSGSTNYTTAGSYSFTVPAGIYSLTVSVIGGGGGGQYACSFGGDSGSGAGGGSGGYYSNQVISVTPKQTISVTVGAGGSLATVSCKPGGSGGTSQISGSGITTLTATGGNSPDTGNQTYGCKAVGTGGSPNGVQAPTQCTDQGNQGGAQPGPGATNGTGYGSGGQGGAQYSTGAQNTVGQAGAVLFSWTS